MAQRSDVSTQALHSHPEAELGWADVIYTVIRGRDGLPRIVWTQTHERPGREPGRLGGTAWIASKAGAHDPTLTTEDIYDSTIFRTS